MKKYFLLLFCFFFFTSNADASTSLTTFTYTDGSGECPNSSSCTVSLNQDDFVVVVGTRSNATPPTVNAPLTQFYSAGFGTTYSISSANGYFSATSTGSVTFSMTNGNIVVYRFRSSGGYFSLGDYAHYGSGSATTFNFSNLSSFSNSTVGDSSVIFYAGQRNASATFNSNIASTLTTFSSVSNTFNNVFAYTDLAVTSQVPVTGSISTGVQGYSTGYIEVIEYPTTPELVYESNGYNYLQCIKYSGTDCFGVATDTDNQNLNLNMYRMTEEFDTIQVFSTSTTPLRFIITRWSDDGVPYETFVPNSQYLDGNSLQTLNSGTYVESVIVATGTHQITLSSPYISTSSDQYLRLDLYPVPSDGRVVIMSQSLDGLGWSMNNQQYLVNNSAFAVRFCNNGCPDNTPLPYVAPPPPDIFGYFADAVGDVFNTRFLSVSNISYASSTEYLSFNVGTFIDVQELDPTNPSRNINRLRVQFGKFDTPDVTTALEFEFNASSSAGVASTSLSIPAIDDGTWTMRITFSNNSFVFNGIQPFDKTFIQFDVAIENGVITGSAVDEAVNALVPTSDNFPQFFYNSLLTFFTSAIETKHPFAWIFQTLTVLETAIAVDYSTSTISIPLNLAPSITSATSSDSYFDFYEYKDSVEDLVTVQATPIATACQFMMFADGEFDVCITFRTIISYVLYIVTIITIGYLAYRLIVTQEGV